MTDKFINTKLHPTSIFEIAICSFTFQCELLYNYLFFVYLESLSSCHQIYCKEELEQISEFTGKRNKNS